MKEGFYLRYVPSINEDVFYVFARGALYSLITPIVVCLEYKIEVSGNYVWQISQHREPLKELGFEFICE